MKTDLTGKRFGSYVVLGRNCLNKSTASWFCRCDCGEIYDVKQYRLLSGKSTRCKKCAKKAIRDNLVEKRFGRLLVLERACHADESRDWICKCDCGNYAIVYGENLKRGLTTSCGCYRKETSSTHGMHDKRLYHIWENMKGRCERESTRAYKHYGGRGITFCYEWSKFEPFYEWAMANGYAENLTLDRIDVNGNYCPENCRWITQAEQLNNTRRSIFLTLNCETHTLKQWSDITGISYNTLRKRVQNGWDTEDILTVPANTYRCYKKKY